MPMANLSEVRKELYADIAEVISGGRSIDHFGKYAADVLRQSLKIDFIRARVVEKRMRRLTSLNPIQTYEDPIASRMIKGNTTIKHNLAGVFNDVSSARSARLVRPLSVIEHLKPLSLINRAEGSLTDLDFENDIKILSIGPRTEAEILMLWAYGFKLENIYAIDLISYSQLIKLGDMHNLEFPNAMFDAIISSCTIVYSSNAQKAIDEIKRVSKPGAIFSFLAHVNNEQYIQNTAKEVGIDIASKNSIASAFFPDNNYEILYTNFVEKNINQPQGTSSSCIFREIPKSF